MPKHTFHAPNFTKLRFRERILRGFLSAAIFSLPIYFNILAYAFEGFSPIFNSLLALAAIYTFINADRRARFYFGFFAGILWFYWTGLSFRFTNMPYFGILAVLFIGFVYGVVFWIMLFFNNKFLRGAALLIVGNIAFFYFDWFVPDSILAFSAFRVDKIAFGIIILCVILVSSKQIWRIYLGSWRFLAIFILIFALDFNTQDSTMPNLKIKLVETNVPQQSKWLRDNIDDIVADNFVKIKEAQNEGYDMIILPETTFPLVLNGGDYGDNIIKEILQYDIAVVAGAMRYDGSKVYNSTFVFQNGEWNAIDKIILAPFGEYIPLPKFAQELYSKIFKTRYSPYTPAQKLPQNMQIKGVRFRSAICYEGTSEIMYLDKPYFMVLISNNAWFKPSIEPILQMTLAKYYARLYGTTIFHSPNGSKKAIITPKSGIKFYTNRL